jgi:hypothetical protein
MIKYGDIQMPKTTSTTKSRKRQAQIDAGVYDGRYKTKVVPDKKKEATKRRVKIDPYKEFPELNRQGM